MSFTRRESCDLGSHHQAWRWESIKKERKKKCSPLYQTQYDEILNGRKVSLSLRGIAITWQSCWTGWHSETRRRVFREILQRKIIWLLSFFRGGKNFQTMFSLGHPSDKDEPATGLGHKVTSYETATDGRRWWNPQLNIRILGNPTKEVEERLLVP